METYYYQRREKKVVLASDSIALFENYLYLEIILTLSSPGKKCNSVYRWSSVSKSIWPAVLIEKPTNWSQGNDVYFVFFNKNRSLCMKITLFVVNNVMCDLRPWKASSTFSEPCKIGGSNLNTLSINPQSIGRKLSSSISINFKIPPFPSYWSIPGNGFLSSPKMWLQSTLWFKLKR